MNLISERKTARTLHLPLYRMALCLDCETCFEIGRDRCPACGSGTWASVGRFLYERDDR
jgi:rRNA maturation endonuclease Nob1